MNTRPLLADAILRFAVATAKWGRPFLRFAIAAAKRGRPFFRFSIAAAKRGRPFLCRDGAFMRSRSAMA
jgi:hypothetical protein